MRRAVLAVLDSFERPRHLLPNAGIYFSPLGAEGARCSEALLGCRADDLVDSKFARRIASCFTRCSQLSGGKTFAIVSARALTAIANQGLDAQTIGRSTFCDNTRVDAAYRHPPVMKSRGPEMSDDATFRKSNSVRVLELALRRSIDEIRSSLSVGP
jgi:hypothetical protein